ncbi:MAG: type VII secretion protein EccCa [Acidimicrobiaceae bacterium]|nr:type VII secretion protein EccCa [Acidimicrobiaceae bacterium]
MSQLQIHRPARIPPPPVPTGLVRVVPPPKLTDDRSSASWLQLLLPLAGTLGSGMYILYNPRLLVILMSAGIALVSVSVGIGSLVHQRAVTRRQVETIRSRYIEYLQRVHRDAMETAEQQQASARWVHPPASELSGIAQARRRVWERRPADDDAMEASVATGPVPLATPLEVEGAEDPLSRPDPKLAALVDRLIREAGTLRSQPMTVNFRHAGSVSVIGAPDAARALVRAAVCELATLCSPEDLRIIVFRSSPPGDDWDWIKWLPHLSDPSDPEGVDRLITTDAQELQTMLETELDGRRETQLARSELRPGAGSSMSPHLLVIIDRFQPGHPIADVVATGQLSEQARALGCTLLSLVDFQHHEPARVDLRVQLQPDGTVTLDGRRGRPAHVDVTTAESLARSLAGLSLVEGTDQPLTGTTTLFPLLGLRPDGTPSSDNNERLPEDTLRMAIGVDGQGEPVHLDLKESALGGMGPHGLVLGATGSGKSELLRTLVAGLALTHSPDELAFVLADFKGGAAFAGLSELPHVAGMITNLVDDLSLVDRMFAALFGEQQRRQQALRKAGNVDSVPEYHRLRRAGRLPGAEPLPYLLVVVDEFGELLTARPDFIELFTAIGRVGRSLGMHLLLASQRLEEGRLRGLEGHLSYRICLRTFSATESRAAIGTADAFHLPPAPGSGYLKVDTTIYQRFKAALVSAPATARPRPTSPSPARVIDFAAGRRLRPAPGLVPSATTDDLGPTQMAVAVDRLQAKWPSAAHQVWLPPLPTELPLADLLEWRQPGSRGAPAFPWGGLRVPVGLLDRPAQQEQVPLSIDFRGMNGHLAIVGAPRSGKSTAVRTVISALVALHSPTDVHVYVLDSGGGSLRALAAAPHIGAVCGRSDADAARRVLTDLSAGIDDREDLLRKSGAESTADYRRQQASNPAPGPDLPEVFLVIDGWSLFTAQFPDLEAVVADLAARGLGVGYHLIITANRWLELRPQLREAIGGRLELRLNEPAESDIDRRAAAVLRAAVPGRGLTAGGLHVQIARPVLDDGLEGEAFARMLANRWPGPGAPGVRLLPPQIHLEELPAAVRETRGVPVGLEESQLSTLAIDVSGPDPHFLVLGDGESGKSTFLRTWLAGLTARSRPEETMILLVDYRRMLADAVPAEYLWAYGGAPPAASSAIRELADGIVERFPPADADPRRLVRQRWWQGPDFYVVVDDYDLVASGSANPLLPLLDLLAQGRDLGLHVVLTRRTGGLVRSSYEPLLSRLLELGTPGIVLAGDPGEGPVLHGVRASPQPPGRGIYARRRAKPTVIQVALPSGTVAA